MKYSGKTVAKRCAAESVAVMTTRPFCESSSRNGKLDAVVLTTTTRPGRPPSAPSIRRAVRSGPTRLNLASAPSKVPWPSRTSSSVSFRVTRRRRSANTRRTFAAVELELPSLSSEKTRTLASGTPGRLEERGDLFPPCLLLGGVLLAAGHARDDDRVAFRGTCRTRGVSRRIKTRIPTPNSHSLRWSAIALGSWELERWQLTVHRSPQWRRRNHSRQRAASLPRRSRSGARAPELRRGGFRLHCDSSSDGISDAWPAAT